MTEPLNPRWGIPQALVDMIDEQVDEIMLITFGRLGLSEKWLRALPKLRGFENK